MRPTITGRVIESPSGSPLSGAMVTIEGSTLTPLDDPREAVDLVRRTLAAFQDAAPDERARRTAPEKWAHAEILPRVGPDLAVLRPLLDARLERERVERVKQLVARGRKEAADLKRIITAQEKRLQKHRAEARKKYGLDDGRQRKLLSERRRVDREMRGVAREVTHG